MLWWLTLPMTWRADDYYDARWWWWWWWPQTGRTKQSRQSASSSCKSCPGEMRIQAPYTHTHLFVHHTTQHKHNRETPSLMITRNNTNTTAPIYICCVINSNRFWIVLRYTQTVCSNVSFMYGYLEMALVESVCVCITSMLLKELKFLVVESLFKTHN